MIKIGLRGHELVAGSEIKLPTVPRNNEFILVRGCLYRVVRVTWLVDHLDDIHSVPVALELDTV